MSIHDIPVVAVSYNAPELLQGMLASMRRFYPNKVHVVDGSGPEFVDKIRAVTEQFENVELHVQGFNIHHGPGMAWAIANLPLGERALFLDTDVVVLREGFLEALNEALRPCDYGAGGVAYVNRDGFDIPYAYGAVAYLHPPCMLCNIEVMRQWPLPIKHGAPMVAPMLALHDAGQSDLLRNLDWAKNDVLMGTRKVYIDHIGMGTSSATGGYHLEEWMAEVQARQAAKPTGAMPSEGPGEGFNPDLLAMIPAHAKAILEVGCSTGALAYALKRQRSDVHYMGMELDPKAAEIAARYCDGMAALDIEGADESLYRDYASRDCWVFGDVLEHLRDPWAVLTKIRKVLPPGGCVVASIPNAQHWSLQARLAVGEFRYESAGLLDRTHLRWFTRVTLFELFARAGLRIEAGLPRIFDEPGREPILAAIRQMAIAQGRDAEGAVRDALPLQYVVRAVVA
ncbi:bifunctional glycosyltransferase/class I SAM-dependent methyltransferase [Paucibacter sp. Y2R2-4]|uniref:bifunctional glycosyltransferase/class I SAM-dependent methyltransferase n=1 Tax=Paucibacter sp. Y2R2-4 TaxID=2893553 RepID=UPI0021E4B17C|nr:bifunctional glycosyltransferase/class I SAM-dependent methyltransferase [Paucibacter sp. Y2R2-4]MCV2348172.1 bifunctional glycosyltransferase/class I SAM-dependent methyltransferase [Paucibacter sp. Y2R2-4]